MLTVGFGDFSPTTTATKILLFPFAVLCIAVLASLVSSIIEYFESRNVHRRAVWKAEYELKCRKIAIDRNPSMGLAEEMTLLEGIQKAEERWSLIYHLTYSIAGMGTFWILGAVIFHFLEEFTMGDSLYFCYVFFLTIGLYSSLLMGIMV